MAKNSIKNLIRFNIKSLEALPPAEQGKRDTYHDSRTPGLILRVTHTGAKTFYVYRKINGSPVRAKLGSFPEMTVEQARNAAPEKTALMRQGVNPNEEARKVRNETTLGTLFGLYLEHYAKIHKKTWAQDEAQFQRYLSHWKNRKLSSIRKAHVRALYASIAENSGKYAANRLMSLIHKMYAEARSDWDYKGENPAHGIKKLKEHSRERFLADDKSDPDELSRFFQSLALETNTTARDYFLVALMTGARRANVQGMRWEQINFDKQIWHIPETKNGEAHSIPLTPTAFDLLNHRRDYSAGEWVFPGKGKTGHLVEPKSAWRRILDRANIKDLRIHDLRRSLGSWQAKTGASLSIIGKTLAHKNVSTTAIYARLGLDPVRESMERAEIAILDAASTNDDSNVVNIRTNQK